MSDPNQPFDPSGQPPANQPPYGQPAYGQPAGGSDPAYGAQPPAYGAQPPAFDPANPYGGYGAPSPYSGMVPFTPYASWGQRVVASLIDALVSMLGAIPYIIGLVLSIANGTKSIDPNTGLETTVPAITGGAALMMLLGALLSIGIFVWNVCLKQGRTGATVGKGVMGIKLIGEASGQPVGAGMSFVRQLVHIVDGIPCNLGYLWPLWDPKKQTFADKILSTVVVQAPKS